MRFADRRSAGQALGESVAALGPHDPLVLALPRGGVPVGYEVAKALGCDLDVLVVRKVGAPRQPELALGAVAEGGVTVRNEDLMRHTGADEADFARTASRESKELERRLAGYRSAAAPIDPAGRVAIIVDDGLATGSTAKAGVEVLRARDAAEVWVAAPVGPDDTVEAIRALSDRVVVAHRPARFRAVGLFYRDFTQTGDDEVRELLAESRLG